MDCDAAILGIAAGRMAHRWYRIWVNARGLLTPALRRTMRVERHAAAGRDDERARSTSCACSRPHSPSTAPGMDYVAWKIERHSGVRIEVAPWQRRFPLLAAPGLYWKLRRREAS